MSPLLFRGSSLLVVVVVVVGDPLPFIGYPPHARRPSVIDGRDRSVWLCFLSTTSSDRPTTIAAAATCCWIGYSTVHSSISGNARPV